MNVGDVTFCVFVISATVWNCLLTPQRLACVELPFPRMKVRWNAQWMSVSRFEVKILVDIAVKGGRMNSA